ncbi:MAG: YfhO family protein [Chitinophagales bacterium]|nr:YfhO family protein [Chitinophagales bacterium]
MQKKLIPHVVAVVVFALLTAIYFNPYYSGKVLEQGDVTQWEGMSKEITDWNKAHPDEPAMWTSRMFGGMPAILISYVFSGNWVSKIMHGLEVVFPEVAAFLFVMMLGFYILLLCFEVDPWLSIAGALAYGFTSFFFISLEAGHNTKVQAMSLMAPAIGGVVLAYRKNILLGAALTALFLSMLIDANHLQVTYYTLLIFGVLGIYFLVENLIEKNISNFAKATGALAVAAALAFLPNVGNLWATQEYGTETIRGGSSELSAKKEATKGGGLDFDYATRWSYGFTDGEILSLLIPDVKGGGSANDIDSKNKVVQQFSSSGYPVEQIKRYVASISYWGNQPFTSGPVYFGAAVCFVFVFSLLIIRSNIKWALLSIIIFSILLASGKNTPFFGWMFNLLPFFNKFRTPAMALVMAEVAIPLTALLGISELFKRKADVAALTKKLYISAAVVGGIILLFGVLGSGMYSFEGANDAEIGKNNPQLISLLKESRADMLQSDALRSLFFVAAATTVLWLFIQQKLSSAVFAICIGMVFFTDTFTVAKRYLNNDNFIAKSAKENAHRMEEYDAQILRDTDPNYRVFNTTRDPFNDAMTSYYHKSVGGYHAAKIIRYQDLIENQISKYNMSVLNMLNTKYFVIQNPQTKQPAVQQNPATCGNSWFVQQIKWAKNADEEMAALTDFDPTRTIVIDERYKTTIGNWTYAGDSSGNIKLLSYTPNKLTYESNATANQLAVFSEIYYNNGKGWNAYIDNQPVQHFRCNYVLRGMVVPSGKHQIEFKFEPRSVVTGNKISMAGSLLLYLFVLSTLGFAGYKKWKEIEAEPAETKKHTTPAAKPTKKK